MPVDEQQLISQKIDNLTQMFELRFTHLLDKMEDIHEQVKGTSGRVTTIEIWKEQNGSMIADITAERKDDRRRLREIFWKGVVLLLAGIANIENIKKLF